LAAALALARTGVKTVIVAPRIPPEQLAKDTRTFAALGGSVSFLETLDVWKDLEPATAPLRGIRIVDDRGGVLRAPEVVFRSSELGLATFGANISHYPMGTLLAAAVDHEPRLTWIDTTAERIDIGDMSATIELGSGGSLDVALIAAADGRNSLARQAAGIEAKAWAYPQTAIACIFTHTRPHDAISSELHGTHGPLTTVPMPDQSGSPCSSLVWVLSPQRADELAALSETDFIAALNTGLQGLLGRIVSIGRRTAFPLSGLEVSTLGQNRVALIGEAGHVVPPIGAQGLNLGFRDAATLAECIEDGLPALDVPALLQTYAQRRAPDVWTRIRGVDALNRSLLASFVPTDVFRGLGLHALAASSSLRRIAMQRGLEPVGARPRLMQRPPDLDAARPPGLSARG
jgi:2-octaprenyl-6-methoxyphenol hydroxylase